MRLRKSLLKTTAVSGVLMVYFYWRHNTYCEPYVYSFFCILEYTIVLCNMGFHVSVFYDLQFAEVSVSNSGGGGGAALQQKNGGGKSLLCAKFVSLFTVLTSFPHLFQVTYLCLPRREKVTL